MGADRPVEPAWPGPEPVSSFIMLRRWGVQCTLHVLWSLRACHRLLRSDRGTYTPVCTCCGPYVRTYVSSFIMIRPWGIHSTWHVLWYVRTCQPLLRPDRGAYTPLCACCGPYVRPSVIIILYDQTVGCTLHSVRVVVRTYVRTYRPLL